MEPNNPYNLPWTVDWSTGEYSGEVVYGIDDCNGNRVVTTDCGYYPPKKDVAEYIVATVNATRKGL